MQKFCMLKRVVHKITMAFKGFVLNAFPRLVLTNQQLILVNNFNCCYNHSTGTYKNTYAIITLLYTRNSIIFLHTNTHMQLSHYCKQGRVGYSIIPPPTPAICFSLHLLQYWHISLRFCDCPHTSRYRFTGSLETQKLVVVSHWLKTQLNVPRIHFA
jgi:hypothetical protein